MSELPRLTLTPRDVFESAYQSRTLDVPSALSYFDAREQVEKRKYATLKKGQQTKRYETKRGYYWDSEMKEKSGKPASNVYKVEGTLVNKSKSVLEKKVDRSLSRHSFLDQIAHRAEKEKTPAPGSYNVIVESKLHKSIDLKDARKRQFFHQFEAQSDSVPGPGAYNPHEVRGVKHKATEDPELARKHAKEKEQKEQRKHEKDLSPLSYGPIVPGTFDEASRRKASQSIRVWGKSERFEYNAKQLSKVRMPNPLPDRYDLSIDWGHSNKKKNWIEAIAKPTPSVYF